MLTQDLFFGVLITDQLVRILEMHPHLRQLFINTHEDYLSEADFHGERYLGRLVGHLSDLPSLELLEKNISSLLLKVAPGYPFHETPLVLFPVNSKTRDLGGKCAG